MFSCPQFCASVHIYLYLLVRCVIIRIQLYLLQLFGRVAASSPSFRWEGVYHAVQASLLPVSSRLSLTLHFGF